MLPHIKFAEFNDLESVKQLITENTCAIFLETVQGEGGIYPATDFFIKGVRQLCDEHKILMISDEIQCGMGRCGQMFAYQIYNIVPDIVVSAKGLGCGIPVGAIGTRGLATGILNAGDHGTTYGSNPLATAAVISVFNLYTCRTDNGRNYWNRSCLRDHGGILQRHCGGSHYAYC